METLTQILTSFGWLVAIAVIVVLAIIALIYVRARWVIADANEAIVITGGRGEPVIRVGGGAFVPPFRRAEKFPLGVMTVASKNDETHTSTMIPVLVEWTAQLRADTSKDDNGNLNESLRNGILGFTNYNGDGGIAGALQQTLEGEVRAVISTLSPEELVRDKATFASKVDEGVKGSMAELGFKLVSLNIGKVSDPNGHYENLSASDREEKRTTNANLTADANQSIAIRTAEADEASKAAEQKRDLAVAEQRRALTLREAQIQAETDLAQADAAIAGQLQTELRNKELAARQGEVSVVREQQAQAAAVARREVEVTEAETAKQKRQIEADATAEALKLTAQGEADAAAIRAQGESDAITRTTEAKATQVRETGLAEAEVVRAKGEAEAAAKRALGEAEANNQLLMAQALSAQEGANLRVTLAQIEATARVTISTQVGEVMAAVGKNAKFIDMGTGAGDDGDLMTRVLGNIPALLAKADVRSDGLLDTTLGGAVGGLLASIREGQPPVASTEAPSPSSEVEVPAADDEVVSDTLVAGAPAPEEVPVASVPIVETVVADGPVSPELKPALDAAVLQQALEELGNGASIASLLDKYGVSQQDLEGLVGRKFTPGELVDIGIKASKSKAGRKKS